MLRMIDLRHVITGVRLTAAERAEAQMRHTVARNQAELKRAKAYNERRGLTPMPIGEMHVPEGIAKHFLYCTTVGGVR